MQMHTTGPDPLNKEKFGPNSPDRTQSVDGPDTSNLAQNMLYTAFVFLLNSLATRVGCDGIVLTQILQRVR